MVGFPIPLASTTTMMTDPIMPSQSERPPSRAAAQQPEARGDQKDAQIDVQSTPEEIDDHAERRADPAENGENRDGAERPG
jgi:hypothetical protein